MKRIRSLARVRTGHRTYWQTAAFAALTVLAGLLLSAPVLAQECFDRAELLSLTGDADRPRLIAADRHVLIVRHARKVSEDCNALDCPLGIAGQAMVTRLDTLLGPEDFDAVYSSSACRTYETALAAGPVEQHAAAPSATALCGGGEADRSRADAQVDVSSSDARWTLVAEHSNTTCGWVGAIAGEDALAGTLCESGRLSSADYGDIFWLHRIDGVWQLTVLEGVFDVAE
ncbi:histidine phosphatase family protein [Hyphobacterium sp.]|uniref:histidine phosphatase family protein n=1 Tax=Hyphobacterium sp. TaxID=2004662 RepID=UPI003BAA5683